MGVAAEESAGGVKRIVSNTGPLLHLEEAQALELLRHTGEVRIPKAVDLEMAHYERKWGIRRPAWIVVEPLAQPYDVSAAQWHQAGLLDGGEAEAVALAQQVRADWFLTDDAAARLFAKSLGIEVHGSLGVVLWAAVIGYLQPSEAEAVLDRLAQSSLWISARVLAEAKAALKKLY